MTATQDEIFIGRCFQLARKAAQRVKSNPNVGAVLVFQNRIIGEGYHEYFGGPHAEVNAIQSVRPVDRRLIAKSTLYVSLEPCNHTGKTGPCTEVILKNKIPRVRISCLDPDQRMQGRSVEYLRSRGVSVETGILNHLGEELICPFQVMRKFHRPYVILKYAQSQDGFMAIAGKQQWFSTKKSKILTHKWRTEADGILIGVNTLNTDNPALTARLYPGPSPIRILIDPNDRRRKDARLLNDGHETWVFTMGSKNVSVRNGTKHIRLNEDIPLLTQVLRCLSAWDTWRLIVEGGAFTLKEFIKRNLWDEARIIRTTKILHEGIPAPAVCGNLKTTDRLNSDEILYIYNQDPKGLEHGGSIFDAGIET